jgi:hypothetical protein
MVAPSSETTPLLASTFRVGIISHAFQSVQDALAPLENALECLYYSSGPELRARGLWDQQAACGLILGAVNRSLGWIEEIKRLTGCDLEVESRLQPSKTTD